MYEDDLLEKLKLRADELTVELGKTQMGSPAYRSISEDLDRIYKMIADLEKRELDRLNSNARNEIEEIKVQLEEKELEVKKHAQNVSVIQTGVYAAVSVGLTVYSYIANKTGMADKTFKDTAKGFLDMVRNFRIR